MKQGKKEFKNDSSAESVFIETFRKQNPEWTKEKKLFALPSVLLNASEATNVVYRVSGLTDEQANAINAINSSNKIMWPVDDTGSHSVTPSTMPNRMAFSISKKVSIAYLPRDFKF